MVVKACEDYIVGMGRNLPTGACLFVSATLRPKLTLRANADLDLAQIHLSSDSRSQLLGAFS
tara:strand:- start:69765 stop:69950 length:186 start_codon:yes stop_codon:yes gene_type:complete